jgi:hypothetical protein
MANTIIGAAVGENPLGKAAPNKPADVTRVQGLLRKVFGGACPALRDGAFDKTMKETIIRFQNEWGGAPDGMVDPHGQTMKRLDRLANPLELNAITLARLHSQYQDRRMVANRGGGYSISYKTCDGGPLPTAKGNYSVYLTVGRPENAINVTQCPAKDVVNGYTLPRLLAILDDEGLWGQAVECRLELRYSDFVISTSAPQKLQAPVEPHNGRMVPLDQDNNGPKLTYQGHPLPFHGRMFVEVPGYPKPLFWWDDRFETDIGYRGFDCITYVGTACGGSNFHMKTNPDLAAHLGATAVTASITTTDPKSKKATTESKVLDYAKPDEVRQFFSAAPTACYVIWRGDAAPGTHVVLVVDGVVHEFNRKEKDGINGYGKTPILQWIDNNTDKKLTVRQLPARPARSFGMTPLPEPSLPNGWA